MSAAPPAPAAPAPAVRLAPIGMEHAPAVQALVSDPAIAATSNIPAPYPPDGAAAFIRDMAAKAAAGTDFAFAVLAGETLAGVVGLHGVGGEPRGAELGYWIGRPYWGRGYATAAARLAVAFGFRELALDELRSSCLERNPASRTVLERAGFRQVGVGGNPDPKWGPEDTFLLVRLTREEWEASRAFPDHFSGHAADYKAHRPGYPPELFARVAALPGARRLAWDAGTGNGQAAVGLAAHFERVVATDASPEQLAHAAPHPRVEYRIARAEGAGLAGGSVDLVTAAQALHWFRFDDFYAEARRVLAPGGAIAVWTYNLARVDPAVNAVIDRLAYELVREHWPPERKWVDEEYRTIPFPFDEIAMTPMAQEERWDLERLLRYLATWSACQRYRKATGRDPLDLVRDDLAAAWGPEPVRTLRWPVFLRAGRN
ncbi:MAG TPA: GNAT family N-acetyltransferase [Thermoanaerobaculia bacterium]|nr:GNAT family N-acetyltransferase [Thermoanaerobaculia bacterium]